jgi:Mg-chelatase subunit ChlD
VSETSSSEDSQWSAVGGRRSAQPDQTFAPSAPFTVRNIAPAFSQRKPQPGRGRRSQTIAVNQGGHYIRAAVPQGSVRDVAVDATLRAAALRQVQGSGRAEQGSGGAGEQGRVKSETPQLPCSPAPLHVLATDLRVKVRRARTGNLFLFVVDV